MSPIVTVDWLHEHIKANNVVVLDATIKKVGSSEEDSDNKYLIPNTRFFDLKNVFLDKNDEFPNTIPEENDFEEQVINLGVNIDSCIIIYDNIGTYSSPRAWWLFKVFGFHNVAVLNGGLPKWIQSGFEVADKYIEGFTKGNFTANLIQELVTNYQQVFENITSNENCTIDARSNERFLAKVPEPRKDLKGGHIPKSVSLPYTEVQEDGEMKPKEELIRMFDKINSENKKFICTCGSGITACILALALEITGKTNYSVYDGSWTEWASMPNLPIEK
ncbi:hypothetical protein BTO06_09520 [Tenacibaculum sp. SZ-18]|nr:hypothetical protein BTO06_09520 [Tenacibaculum sp. SZ-18]